MHSRGYGGSSIGNTMKCLGYPRMTTGIEDVSNDAANEGTAAHELAEFCLKLGINAFDCIGMTFNEHTVSETMADGVQTYLTDIRAIANSSKLYVEQRVNLTSVDVRCFGTNDCAFIVGDTLYIHDLKYGYGLVNVENNSQLAFYAVGFLDTFSLWSSIKNVVGTIVQPRGNHIDGVVRRFTFTVEHLKEWQQCFKYVVSESSKPDAPTTAGEHCTYCPAAGFCRSRIERTLSLVGLDAPVDKLDADEVETIYRELPTIKRTLEKVEVRMLEIARSGKRLHDYKLVKAIVRSHCKDESALINEAKSLGLTDEQLFSQKLKSKTDLSKLKPLSKVIHKHFEAPPASTTLAPLTDKRPAIGVGSAIGVFGAIE